MSTAPATQRPRRKHLMDPNAPQRDTINSPGTSRVQTWVMSTLVVSSILHMAAGVLVAAWFMDDSQVVARVGLSVIAGAFGVLAVMGGLAIHKRPVLTWWNLLGLIPMVVGFALFL
ncbi:hypothetical protein [Nocardioides bruguierae]|uniref:Uncharacterized protein n=1 Tax=Nocardioides bruguierae TaxID=2945102 RepID=A0A9X2IEW3_9ACTN|nr:hypothetical protein [Nocardioides bruguierae]MCM0620483.1 hypothetical protein [Nocardioides bruguierae]